MADLQGGKDPLECICQSTEFPSIPMMFCLETKIVTTKRHIEKGVLDFVRTNFIATKKSRHKTMSFNSTSLSEIIASPLCQQICIKTFSSTKPDYQGLSSSHCCPIGISYGATQSIKNDTLACRDMELIFTCQTNIPHVEAVKDCSWISISIQKYCPIYVFERPHIIIPFVFDM